jgi:biopolymer transport protein TolR
MSISLSSLSGSGRKRGQKYKPRAEINVTPMVDVMLVLLIVFMITAPLMTTGVDVNLPEVVAKPITIDSEPLTITIDAAGTVYLMETQITADDLVAKLIAISKNGAQERIVLRADKDINYGAVMNVMARVHSAGFVNLALATEPGL